MSSQLLLRVKNHIVDQGGLLTIYAKKYYRWSDADLKGSGGVALFRITGTAGRTDAQAQQIDVSLFLLADPKLVTQADSDMLGVLRYLRANYSDSDAFQYRPLQSYTGPVYMENGRAMFEMVIRCGVEDH
jgi:hypothetical protein